MTFCTFRHKRSCLPFHTYWSKLRHCWVWGQRDIFPSQNPLCQVQGGRCIPETAEDLGTSLEKAIFSPPGCGKVGVGLWIPCVEGTLSTSKLTMVAMISEKNSWKNCHSATGSAEGNKKKTQTAHKPGYLCHRKVEENAESNPKTFPRRFWC